MVRCRGLFGLFLLVLRWRWSHKRYKLSDNDQALFILGVMMTNGFIAWIPDLLATDCGSELFLCVFWPLSACAFSLPAGIQMVWLDRKSYPLERA